MSKVDNKNSADEMLRLAREQLKAAKKTLAESRSGSQQVLVTAEAAKQRLLGGRR